MSTQRKIERKLTRREEAEGRKVFIGWLMEYGIDELDAKIVASEHTQHTWNLAVDVAGVVVLKRTIGAMGAERLKAFGLGVAVGAVTLGGVLALWNYVF